MNKHLFNHLTEMVSSFNEELDIPKERVVAELNISEIDNKTKYCLNLVSLCDKKGKKRRELTELFNIEENSIDSILNLYINGESVELDTLEEKSYSKGMKDAMKKHNKFVLQTIDDVYSKSVLWKFKSFV